MLHAPEVPRHVPVSRRDSNAGSDGDSIVLPAGYEDAVDIAQQPRTESQAG